MEHFELESHLSPRINDRKAFSHLCKVEHEVQRAVDPIDPNSLDRLAEIFQDVFRDRFRNRAARQCHDLDFIDWVMGNNFYDEIRPSTSQLRQLLERQHLSLSRTSDMYPRIVRILGETCRKQSILRNRDSGVSVGDGGEFEDQGSNPDRSMVYESGNTVDPQQLTVTRGVNQRGIGGTQSSRY